MSTRRHHCMHRRSWPRLALIFGVGTLLIATILLSLSNTGLAASNKRVALVIGNSAYAKVPRLKNPANDALAIEAMLKSAGFDAVVRVTDVGAAQMRRVLRDFSDVARDADVALVFYAGHGMEMNGINYLVPVDAVLERDLDVDDEAVPLERVSQVLEQARRLRLIILDACRDNPFVRSINRTVATRSIGRGLARVDVVSSDTLIAYAAKAGSTAADGDADNSPYTSALVNHLATPGLDVRLALGRVRDDVLRKTGHRQEPFVYGSLGGAEVNLVAAPAAPVQATAPSDEMERLRSENEALRQKQASPSIAPPAGPNWWDRLLGRQQQAINVPPAKPEPPPPPWTTADADAALDRAVKFVTSKTVDFSVVDVHGGLAGNSRPLDAACAKDRRGIPALRGLAVALALYDVAKDALPADGEFEGLTKEVPFGAESVLPGKAKELGTATILANFTRWRGKFGIVTHHASDLKALAKELLAYKSTYERLDVSMEWTKGTRQIVEELRGSRSDKPCFNSPKNLIVGAEPKDYSSGTHGRYALDRPHGYFLGFWYRRQVDGTSALAEAILKRFAAM